MSAFAAALSICDAFWRALLRLAGIDPALRWPWVMMAILLKPSVVRGRAGWQKSVSALFPQVDFERLGLLDLLLRIPIQLLWLVLVRPAPVAAPAPRRAPIQEDRARQTEARKVVRRARRELNRAVAVVSRQITRGLGILHGGAIDPGMAESEGIRLLQRAALVLAAPLALLLVTTPLDSWEQAAFAGVLWIATLVLRRVTGPSVGLVMVSLSLLASTRYFWWRIAYTLNWDAPVDLVWGLLLILAEGYAWLMLLLGYFQTVQPLRRAAVPLRVDPRHWPTVDIYIPTYNEPLSVVLPTVVAAVELDWPREKLNVYLLDDGRRDAFRLMAQELGVNYIVRADNLHAKAGNLNNALAETKGQFIAIFDSDHVPTRSFLRQVMGGFLLQPRLALVQTPHHFYSPDPFERNLDKFRRIPSEGELFHSLVQDGNDLWNATFFCGSCAVLRRSALEEIGGFAVETVTEDAHTALRLQRRGFDTALVNAPLAAGLATESLSAHIGQRIRWARGMAQIFRLDNPFVGSGLTWAQRLCYASSMLHFFHGGPRLVFLTAPIAYLLVNVNVIEAAPIDVLLYALPHMAVASLTSSRLQGAHRSSFWSEVYETVLAWYITWPTLVALVAPRKGRFNVTVKGGGAQQGYFDWTIAIPFLALAAINLAAFATGAVKLGLGPASEMGTTLLNMSWGALNITLLGAAIAVALQPQQRRGEHRAPLRVGAVVRLPNGRELGGETLDVSRGGAGLCLRNEHTLAVDDPVLIALGRRKESVQCLARVSAITPRGVHVRWEALTRDQERALVRCTIARRNAWTSWRQGRRPDRLLRSLRDVMDTGLAGYQRLGSHVISRAAHRSASWVRVARPILHGTVSLMPRTPKLRNAYRVPIDL